MPNASAAAPIYILLGTIGSGKTLQAENLEQVVGGQSFSIGSLIRQHFSNDPRMARGELLPDEEVNTIVVEAIKHVPLDQPIIFDGFPRVISQKHWLEAQSELLGRHVKQVFYLKVDEAEVNRRLNLRGRADDTVAAIKQRKQVFNTETLPVLEAYQSEGLLSEIDGNPSPEQVEKLLLDAVEN
jgi:adenylate kinase